MDAWVFGAVPQRTYYRETILSWNDAPFFVGAPAALARVALARASMG